MHQQRSRLLVPDSDRSLRAVAAIAAAMTVVCILAIDQPFARWLATRDTWPELWNRGIDALEYVALITPWKWTGVSVLMLGIVSAFAIPRWRPLAPAWLLVASTHLLARNVMMWGKFATGRLRPTEWLARTDPGATFFRDDGFSFPSGHVMLFASLALPIAIVWPRARLPMFAIVAFAMVARVAVNAHFLSDVTCGLALSAAITWACASVVRRASEASADRAGALPKPPASSQ